MITQTKYTYKNIKIFSRINLKEKFSAYQDTRYIDCEKPKVTTNLCHRFRPTTTDVRRRIPSVSVSLLYRGDLTRQSYGTHYRVPA